MNKSMLPFLISKMNQFHHEAMQEGFHCGKILCSILKHVCKDRKQYNLMENSLLTTRNFYNSLHFDHDFMNDFESNVVKEKLKNCGIFQCLQFIENYKSSFPHIYKLPMQTTRCGGVSSNRTNCTCIDNSLLM